MGMDVKLIRLVRRILPGVPVSEGAVDEVPPRGGPYGEQFVLSPVPTKHLLASEGSYWVATNPTFGSAIAGPVLAAFSDTTPFIYIQNNDRVRELWLDYLKLVITVAPASSVQAYIAVTTDQQPRSFTTDNTAASTANSPCSGAPALSNVLIKVQNSATASVVGASSSGKRNIGRGAFGGLPIVGDELVAVFGAADHGPYQGLTAAQAVCPGRKVTGLPPVCLAPGTCATIHLWFPGNAATGLSFEYELTGMLR